MRVPVPEAPELTPAGFCWAALVAVAWFVLTAALVRYCPPAAIGLQLVLLGSAVWLIGGEMWNARQDGRG